MTEPLARAAEAIGDTINKGTAQAVLENAALAALCAIKQPSTAMITSGAKNIPGSEARACAHACWHDMIEAMIRG